MKLVFLLFLGLWYSNIAMAQTYEQIRIGLGYASVINLTDSYDERWYFDSAPINSINISTPVYKNNLELELIINDQYSKNSDYADAITRTLTLSYYFRKNIRSNISLEFGPITGLQETVLKNYTSITNKKEREVLLGIGLNAHYLYKNLAFFTKLSRHSVYYFERQDTFIIEIGLNYLFKLPDTLRGWID